MDIIAVNEMERAQRWLGKPHEMGTGNGKMTGPLNKVTLGEWQDKSFDQNPSTEVLNTLHESGLGKHVHMIKGVLYTVDSVSLRH